MSGEKNLEKLLKEMKPLLNPGDFVFTTIKNLDAINRADTICEFKEAEGVTVVIEKNKADMLNLRYVCVVSWITLRVHSSLEAVGLTAKFSAALTLHDISCNVIAGYYHDHIFVDKKDAKKAVRVLTNLSKKYQ
ncbi:ACT domain-containing protein [Algibacter sp. PT7-4]|uniref:ACT domain-containing protein n=1 Tax=Algibacter ulvanivorans TaxID=3400999 RepID=UPI003AAF8C62